MLYLPLPVCRVGDAVFGELVRFQSGEIECLELTLCTMQALLSLVDSTYMHLKNNHILFIRQQVQYPLP